MDPSIDHRWHRRRFWFRMISCAIDLDSARSFNFQVFFWLIFFLVIKCIISANNRGDTLMRRFNFDLFLFDVGQNHLLHEARKDLDLFISHSTTWFGEKSTINFYALFIGSHWLSLVSSVLFLILFSFEWKVVCCCRCRLVGFWFCIQLFECSHSLFCWTFRSPKSKNFRMCVL